jgi:hypothetical protein
MGDPAERCGRQAGDSPPVSTRRPGCPTRSMHSLGAPVPTPEAPAARLCIALQIATGLLHEPQGTCSSLARIRHLSIRLPSRQANRGRLLCRGP